MLNQFVKIYPDPCCNLRLVCQEIFLPDDWCKDWARAPIQLYSHLLHAMLHETHNMAVTMLYMSIDVLSGRLHIVFTIYALSTSPKITFLSPCSPFLLCHVAYDMQV